MECDHAQIIEMLPSMSVLLCQSLCCWAAAAGYVVPMCSCTGCTNPIRTILNGKKGAPNRLSAEGFRNRCFSLCNHDPRCEVAVFRNPLLTEKLRNVCFLYDHAHETVKQSTSSVGFFCFVKAAACKDGDVYCNPSKTTLPAPTPMPVPVAVPNTLSPVGKGGVVNTMNGVEIQRCQCNGCVSPKEVLEKASSDLCFKRCASSSWCSVAERS